MICRRLWIMLCPKCRKAVPDDFIYCPYCGKKLLKTKRKRSRRPSSSGSVRYISENRSRPWQALLPAEYIDGKKIQKTLGYFKTSLEADAALAQFRASKNKDSFSLTLQDIYEQFVAGKYFNELSKSGQQSHKGAWKHLSKYAQWRIMDIKTAQIQDVVDILASNGRSKETAAKVRNLASKLCETAMKNDLMDKNYALLVDLSGKEKVEAKIFTSEQLKTLWEYKDDEMVASILVMCYTGIRPNEQFNLQIEDVHLNSYAYFQAGSKTKKGKGREGTGRVIPIIHDIRPLVLKLIDGRNNGYLIRGLDGEKVLYRSWLTRFYRTLEKCGLQKIPDKNERAKLQPYSCRHTYATGMVRAGAKPELLTEILGHEKYETTMNNYNHYTDEDIKALCLEAEKISNSFNLDSLDKKNRL